MTAPSRRMHYTYQEYLALEEESAIRHEYLTGEIYAMAGGTPDRAALAAAVLAILRPQLPRGCRAFTSDLRVRISSTGLTTYPDAAVVCGGSQRAPEDPVAVTNPLILVEVTSNSTEAYDRGEKLRHYRAIPSLREILVVSHREPRITIHRRGDGDRWESTDAAEGQSATLESIGGLLQVDDVYRDGLEDAGPRA
ncbi:MAG TPA: Uma2 family endonuclease [Thermoanaerobaculia bacterium]